MIFLHLKMETKTKKLDVLFTEWVSHYPEYKGIFVKDGIINEKKWDNIEPKILFIAKEPNHDFNPQEGDFRIDWNNKKLFPFSYRIAEWAWGIINNFPIFEKFYHNSDWLENYSEALQNISFMNVKKSGGGGIANHTEIYTAIEKTKSFILKEIEIIQPQIIVASLVNIDLINSLFNVKQEQWVKSGYVRCVFKWENIKIIDFYHPSSRIAPAASYSLLQNIIQSPAFKNL